MCVCVLVVDRCLRVYVFVLFFLKKLVVRSLAPSKMEGVSFVVSAYGKTFVFIDCEKYFDSIDKKFQQTCSRRTLVFKAKERRATQCKTRVKWQSSADANILSMPMFKVYGFILFENHQLAASFRICKAEQNMQNIVDYISFAPHSHMSLSIGKYVYDAFMVRFSRFRRHYLVILCIHPLDGAHMYYTGCLDRQEKAAYLAFFWDMLNEHAAFCAYTLGYVPEIKTLSVIIVCQ